MQVSLVNRYLAHKQHLLPASQLTNVVQITRDVVSLHATDATGPYLSLWARTRNFQRQSLEDALYSRRELSRVHCMRMTLHVVPSTDVPYFFQAYAEHRIQVERDSAALLVLAGLCHGNEAGKRLKKLHHRVMSVLARHASVAADYVCGDIVTPVSHRQPFAGRVGEEIQTVELVIAWFGCAIYTPLLPGVPPFRLYRVRIVFAAFDLSPVSMESSNIVV